MDQRERARAKEEQEAFISAVKTIVNSMLELRDYYDENFEKKKGGN